MFARAAMIVSEIPVSRIIRGRIVFLSTNQSAPPNPTERAPITNTRTNETFPPNNGAKNTPNEAMLNAIKVPHFMPTRATMSGPVRKAMAQPIESIMLMVSRVMRGSARYSVQLKSLNPESTDAPAARI
jgi:hypothetical protein